MKLKGATVCHGFNIRIFAKLACKIDNGTLWQVYVIVDATVCFLWKVIKNCISSIKMLCYNETKGSNKRGKLSH